MAFGSSQTNTTWHARFSEILQQVQSKRFSLGCYYTGMAYELWKKEMHPFYRKAYKQTGYSQYEYRDLEKKQSFLHVQLSIQVHLDICP